MFHLRMFLLPQMMARRKLRLPAPQHQAVIISLREQEVRRRASLKIWQLHSAALSVGRGFQMTEKFYASFTTSADLRQRRLMKLRRLLIAEARGAREPRARI